MSGHVRWAVCTQGRSATSAPACLPAQTWACFPLKSLLLDIITQYANQISEKRLLVNKQTLKLGLASGTLPNQLVCLSASDQGDVSLSGCKVKHLPTSHRSPRAVQLHLSFLFIIFFLGPLPPSFSSTKHHLESQRQIGINCCASKGDLLPSYFESSLLR